MLTKDGTRGFTLIEALVAIAILVAGLAGSAALLLQTVTRERESGSRRAALRIAASMAEQLRAVRRPDGRAVLAITGVDAAVACADQPANCGSERAAGMYLSAWSAEAAAALPQGAAFSVVVPDPRVPEYLIAIDWPGIGGEIEHLLAPVTT